MEVVIGYRNSSEACAHHKLHFVSSSRDGGRRAGQHRLARDSLRGHVALQKSLHWDCPRHNACLRHQVGESFAAHASTERSGSKPHSAISSFHRNT